MGATILVVDDEVSAVQTILAALEGKGFNLETATNGDMAIKKAISLQPDMVLLDVMMPGMNGFEVCRLMRANPLLTEIPIVILTALEDRKYLLRGIEAGADDYLVKPIDRQELIARVQTITRLNRYRKLASQREDIQLLVNKIVHVQDKERKELSRNLHDDLGQPLTAHKISLHHLKEELEKGSPNIADMVDYLISETTGILDRIHSITQNLRPVALDTLVFQLAVFNYCQEFSLHNQLPVILDIDPALEEIPEAVGTILYSVIQDVFTNVLKQVDASQVWVELLKEEGKILLTIRDNGKGFPEELEIGKGLGLAGTQERIEQAGGSLKVLTSGNRGSILLIRVPVVNRPQAT